MLLARTLMSWVSPRVLRFQYEFYSEDAGFQIGPDLFHCTDFRPSFPVHLTLSSLRLHLEWKECSSCGSEGICRHVLFFWGTTFSDDGLFDLAIFQVTQDFLLYAPRMAHGLLANLSIVAYVQITAPKWSYRNGP